MRCLENLSELLRESGWNPVAARHIAVCVRRLRALDGIQEGNNPDLGANGMIVTGVLNLELPHVCSLFEDRLRLPTAVSPTALGIPFYGY